jgi:hypothetical protein
MIPNQMSRQEVLDFMEQNWSVYLPTLDSIPIDEREAFAQEHGYPGTKELIAHIAGGWREAILIVSAVMAGQQPALDYDGDDEFNARIIENARSQPYEEVEAEFENAREEIAGLVAELPDAAFDNPQIYDELYGEIVTHYRQHLPPGLPTFR